MFRFCLIGTNSPAWSETSILILLYVTRSTVWTLRCYSLQPSTTYCMNIDVLLAPAILNLLYEHWGVTRSSHPQLVVAVEPHLVSQQISQSRYVSRLVSKVDVGKQLRESDVPVTVDTKSSEISSTETHREHNQLDCNVTWTQSHRL